MKQRLPTLALLLLVSACAPGANLAPIPPYQADYKLGPDDRIRVIVFGEDQISNEYRVDDRGNIAVPLLGTTHAAGQTPEQLGQTIATGLRKQDLLRKPSVAVEIEAYRPVFVLGEVAKPGQYPYQPGMTMLSTVAVAGGFTYRAVRQFGDVVRTSGDHAAEGRMQRDSFVAPGDVIEILERYF